MNMFNFLTKKFNKQESEAEVGAELVESKSEEENQDQKEQSTKARGFLSKYKTALQSAILGAALVVVEEKLSDEQIIKEIFNRFTEALPRPIRFLLPREAIFQYLMNSRVQIINHLKDLRLPAGVNPLMPGSAAGAPDDIHQISVVDVTDNLLLEGPVVEPSEARIL